MKDGEISFFAKRCQAKIQPFSLPKIGHNHVSFVGTTDKNYKISGENGVVTNFESVNVKLLLHALLIRSMFRF